MEPLPQFRVSQLLVVLTGFICQMWCLEVLASASYTNTIVTPGQDLSITVNDKTVHYWQAPSLKPLTLANVLITHEVGYRYDSEPLMKGLIRDFAQRGYRVVSLATPSLDPNDILKESQVAQFETELLTQLNQIMGEAFSDTRYKRFIVSHGRSSYWLGKLLGQSELKVHGFAAVSTYFPEASINTQIPAQLAKLNCFVLDVYAARAPLWSLQTAQSRRALSASRQGLYRQLVIENAGHSFRLHENVLVNRIDGWMRTSLKEGKGQSN